MPSSFLGRLPRGDVKPFGFVSFPTGGRFFFLPLLFLSPVPVRHLRWLLGVFPFGPGCVPDVLGGRCFNHCLGIFSSVGAFLIGAEFSQQPFWAAGMAWPRKDLSFIRERVKPDSSAVHQKSSLLLLVVAKTEPPKQTAPQTLGLALLVVLRCSPQQFQPLRRYSWQQHLAHFLAFFTISSRKLSLHFFRSLSSSVISEHRLHCFCCFGASLKVLSAFPHSWIPSSATSSGHL